MKKYPLIIRGEACLDVHKNTIPMIDDAGREVKKGRFPTTREGLEKFSGDLPGDAKVAFSIGHLCVRVSG